MTLSHNTTKTFHQLPQSLLGSFKDDIELKLKQQRPTNVYHAEKTLKNLKEWLQVFTAKQSTFLKRDDFQTKHPGDPKITQLNPGKKLFKVISAKSGSSLYKHSLTEVTALSSGAQ